MKFGNIDLAEMTLFWYIAHGTWTPIEAALIVAGLKPASGLTQIPEVGAPDFKGKFQGSSTERFAEARRVLRIWNKQPNPPAKITPYRFVRWCQAVNAEASEDFIDCSDIEELLPGGYKYEELLTHAPDLARHIVDEWPPEDIIERWDIALKAHKYIALSNVPYQKAALLLSGLNPRAEVGIDLRKHFSGETDEDTYDDLFEVFEDSQKSESSERSLLDWLQLANDRRLEYHSWIDEYLKACRALGHDVNEAASKSISLLRASGKVEPNFKMGYYEEALEGIRHVGVAMERHRRTYIGRQEHDLRNEFVVHLSGKFGGNATGESLNGDGKTDILLRLEGENELIAECKFWDGPKTIGDAIDQLFRYATPRDRKLGIIVFNQDTATRTVLDGIDAALNGHKQFLRMEKWNSEYGFRCSLTHPDDESCECLLSVMQFRIPSQKTS